MADSKPIVGEMDSRAARQAGSGGRLDEFTASSCLTGDLVEVDQPCLGVNVNRLPRAIDMLDSEGCVQHCGSVWTVPSMHRCGAYVCGRSGEKWRG